MRVDIHINKDREGFFTIAPHGSIDSDHYLDFSDQIKPLLVPETKGIILDLDHIDYISSAGLGVIFTMKKFMVSNKGALLFCNLKPQIERLFEIVNALPKETLFKNVEEADVYLYKMMDEEIARQKEKRKE